MSPKKFAVVIFVVESGAEEVGLIPTTWLIDQERKCWWPPYKSASKVTKAIQENWKPEEGSWSLHSVRILSKCCNYATGRNLARRAEICSDIQSEEEYGRGHRRIRPAVVPSDDSSGSTHTPVQLKKSRPVVLPEAPVVDDLEELSVAGTGGQHSSTPAEILRILPTVVEKEVRPVLRAVAQNEVRIEEQYKAISEVLSIVKNLKHQFSNLGSVSTVPDTSLLAKLLPLKTYEELTDFEEKLALDSDLKLALEHRLRLLGGTTVKTTVKYIIDYCLTSKVQHQFNWEGRIGWKTKINQSKKGFKNTRLCELMMNVIINKRNLQTDEAEVRKAMMIYLRNAGDRYFGRKRRSEGDSSNQGSSSQEQEF